MFSYRGRKLNINEAYIRDFNEYAPFAFNERWADHYVYSIFKYKKYICKDMSSAIRDIDDLRLEKIINKGLKTELRGYTGDVNYGER